MKGSRMVWFGAIGLVCALLFAVGQADYNNGPYECFDGSILGEDAIGCGAGEMLCVSGDQKGLRKKLLKLQSTLAGLQHEIESSNDNTKSVDKLTKKVSKAKRQVNGQAKKVQKASNGGACKKISDCISGTFELVDGTGPGYLNSICGPRQKPGDDKYMCLQDLPPIDEPAVRTTIKCLEFFTPEM